MANARPSARPPERVLRQLGLHYVSVSDLTIRRRRNGHGFLYINGDGRPLRDQRTLYRLKRLAVPPAYADVLYAADPHAHLQAVGRDAAGRTQYRYHPDWEKIRELRKARRLARLAEALPKIRAWVSRHLRDREPNREQAIAALIELVGLTALRPGSESYARQNGTRGATTLLKSNLRIGRDWVALRFIGKGGRPVEKDVRSRRLAQALKRLQSLPGRRVFQYRNVDGAVVVLHRQDVNDTLRAIARRPVSLKDFRTLIASSNALEQLSSIEPKANLRGRRRQLRATMRTVAAGLANTPAVCRKSYVHAAVVTTFEAGELHSQRGRLQSPAQREQLLIKMLARVTA